MYYVLSFAIGALLVYWRERMMPPKPTQPERQRIDIDWCYNVITTVINSCRTPHECLQAQEMIMLFDRMMRPKVPIPTFNRYFPSLCAKLDKKYKKIEQENEDAEVDQFIKAIEKIPVVK